MMSPVDWEALARRCQKPAHRTAGTWLARRIARPAALRITWLLLPRGVSPHAMTGAAWVVGLAGAGLLAWGGASAWLAAGGLLLASYLLDHVDGQLARGQGRATLDGIELDYRMHHVLTLVVPWGAGYGLTRSTGEQHWLALGLAWSLGAWLLGSEYDIRAKALLTRLKRLEGTLLARGRGGPATSIPAAGPRSVWSRGAWGIRKLVEWHVTIQSITLLGLVTAVGGGDLAARGYVALLGVLAPLAACVRLGRQLQREAAEHEFAAWFDVPRERMLIEIDGRWQVVPLEAEEPELGGTCVPVEHRGQRSS